MKKFLKLTIFIIFPLSVVSSILYIVAILTRYLSLGGNFMSLIEDTLFTFIVSFSALLISLLLVLFFKLKYKTFKGI